jgi:hypothetical protein
LDGGWEGGESTEEGYCRGKRACHLKIKWENQPTVCICLDKVVEPGKAAVRRLPGEEGELEFYQ